jgi:predicted dinucleotide-binding enzyme
VKAFNTIFADNMRSDRLVRGAGRVSCFIASDYEDAAAQVAKLASAIGFDPVLTGALQHARYLEAIAHLNIALLARNGLNTSAAFIYDAGTV